MPLGRRSRKYNNTIICLAALVGIPPQHTNNRRHWWVEDRAPDKPSLSSPTSQASSQTQAKPTLGLVKPGLGFGKPGKPGLPRPQRVVAYKRRQLSDRLTIHTARIRTSQTVQPVSQPVALASRFCGYGSGYKVRSGCGFRNRCSFGTGVGTGVGLGAGTAVCQGEEKVGPCSGLGLCMAA